jgi:hypothetical protein
MAPVIELSSADKAAVPIQEGFSQLAPGAHELRCTLRGRAIVAKVRVYPPAAGACMGAGYVSVDTFVVGNNTVVVHPVAFNWQCPGEDILMRLVVAVTPSGPSITTCLAKNWEWGIGFSGVECSTKSEINRVRLD